MGGWEGTCGSTSALLLICNDHAAFRREKGRQTKIKKNPTIKTNLEEVILVHNTAVRQRLDQFICQGGFTTICDPKN